MSSRKDSSLSSVYSPEQELAIRTADRLLTPKLTPYIPHRPHPAQTAFLLLEDLEAFYGGAAGGGKSDAILMGALQYADTADYAALILRKSFTDLALPGAVMDRAHGWLSSTDAVWNERDHRWLFPLGFVSGPAFTGTTGAVLQFGYLERSKDRYRYQSAEFQFIGFDELTQFEIDEYMYMFTRLRRLEGSRTPLRVRSASNPGGIGHEWVRQRFIPRLVADPVSNEMVVEYPRDDEGKRRRFIPAKLSDNPSVDRAEYTKSLRNVDPILRAQMLEGDWTAAKPGNKFRRDWFTIIDRAPRLVKRVRYWDLASTEETGSNDPDWAAGARLGLTPGGEIVIEDIRRMRGTPGAVESFISSTAMSDNPEGPPGFPIWIEQEPGSAGAAVISTYQRRVLRGYTVRGHRPTGDKWTRADVLASRAEAGQVLLVRGNWVPAFLEEAEAFSEDGTHGHDDQVDAAVGAYVKLADGGEAKSTQYVKPAQSEVIRRGDLTLRGAKYIDKVPGR